VYYILLNLNFDILIIFSQLMQQLKKKNIESSTI